MKLGHRKRKLSQFAADDPANWDNFVARINMLIEASKSVASLAKAAGVSEGALRNWAFRGAEPSRANLIALARAAGVNVLWLATGEGPMRPGDTQAPAQVEEKGKSAEEKRDSPADVELLTDIIRAVEELLAEAKRTITPDKKAQVIALLYELGLQGMWQEDNPRTVERILRLVS